MLKRDYERILDDLKIVSKIVKIIRDENNPENKKFTCSLAEDVINRIFRDVKEVYDATHPQNDTTSYGGILPGSDE